MTTIKKFLLTFTIVLLPMIAAAQGGLAGKLIICNESMDAVVASSDNTCDFNDLIEVANLFINLLIQLALAISVLILLITGAKYLFAGSADAKKVAKESFKKLVIGFAFILGSYLIVNTLFAIAGVDTAFKFLESQPDQPTTTAPTNP